MTGRAEDRRSGGGTGLGTALPAGGGGIDGGCGLSWPCSSRGWGRLHMLHLSLLEDNNCCQNFRYPNSSFPP